MITLHMQKFSIHGSAACTQFIYEKNVRACNFSTEICLGQLAHSLMYGSIFWPSKIGHQAQDHELILFLDLILYGMHHVEI